MCVGMDVSACVCGYECVHVGMCVLDVYVYGYESHV